MGRRGRLPAAVDADARGAGARAAADGRILGRLRDGGGRGGRGVEVGLDAFHTRHRQLAARLVVERDAAVRLELEGESGVDPLERHACPVSSGDGHLHVFLRLACDDCPLSSRGTAKPSHGHTANYDSIGADLRQVRVFGILNAT